MKKVCTNFAKMLFCMLAAGAYVFSAYDWYLKYTKLQKETTDLLAQRHTEQAD